MIHNTFSIELRTDYKKCFQCGKEALYVIKSNNIYGWRLCFRHLPKGVKQLLAHTINSNSKFYIEWPEHRLWNYITDKDLSHILFFMYKDWLSRQ